MSTPLLNSVGVTSFTRAPGDAGAIQEGVKWGGAYGTGVTLTLRARVRIRNSLRDRNWSFSS